MFLLWIVSFAMVIGVSSQEKPLTDENLRRKLIAVAQCEVIHEHMCPYDLCSVKSALNWTVEPDDHWTPAQNFCDNVCLSNSGCRTICKCAKDRIGSLPSSLSDRHSGALSAPRLHCREPSMISIEWEAFRGKANEKYSIVYAVEMHVHGDHHWKPFSLTRNRIAVIKRLLPLQKYQFRVSAVGAFGIFITSPSSEPISTLPPAAEFEDEVWTLDAPVSVKQIGPVEYTNESASVRIRWEPGQDATCTHELFWSSDNDTFGRYYIEQYNVAESPMETRLKNLTLGHTYHLKLKSLIKNPEIIESNEIPMDPLVIKDCLTAFNYDLTICRPAKPERLDVAVNKVDANTTRVQVSWESVKGNPGGYNVSLFGPKMKLLDSRIVGSTETSADFDRVPAETEYYAIVGAFSAAGRGNIAYKMKKTGSSGDSTSDGATDAVLSVTERTPTKYSSNASDKNNTRGSAERGEALPTDYLINLSVGAVVVVAAFGLVTAVGGVCTLCRRKTHRRPQSEIPEFQDMEEVEKGSESIGDSLDLGERDLILNEQIGEGAFGTVWLGLLSNPTGTVEVAVKMLKENPTTEEIRHFDNEMSILKGVKLHPNVVRCIGYKTSVQRKMIILEYCQYGDLQNYLNNCWNDFMKEPQEGSLNYVNFAVENMMRARMDQNCAAVTNSTYRMILHSDRVKFSAMLIRFAREVSSGMEFLAASNILHRDLAARNVLIVSDMTTRISDFGLSREVLETSVYRKLGSEKVAVRWIAPEVFETRTFTEKSDVWSYGVLLWEIATLASTPYACVENISNFLAGGGRLDQPATCSEDLHRWMLWCWQQDPACRPNFHSIRIHMENLEMSEGGHIFLDRDKLVTLKEMRRKIV